MRRTAIIMFLSLLSPLAVQAQDWDPISGYMAIEGNLALVEVRAVDDSRDNVLSTKFLWLESDPADGEPVKVFEPGELAHENHAQVRLQLQEGERFGVDLLSREDILDPGEEERLILEAAVTITVWKGDVMIRTLRLDNGASRSSRAQR